MASERNFLTGGLLLTLAFCAGIIFTTAHQRRYVPAPIPGIVTLKDDNGGNVGDHVKWYARIQQAAVPVRIEGFCNSACTFVLHLPASQVCMAPDASLGFHQAFDVRTGKTDLAVTNFIIRTVYPKPVQNWLHAQGPLTRTIKPMDAATAVKLGVVHPCP